MLEVIAVPAFSDNYIWLIRAPNAPDRVVVVDPGDAGPVLDILTSDGLDLAGILITHKHADHIGGVEDLLAAKPGIELFGPDHPAIPLRADTVRDGDTVRMPTLGLEFAVRAVPGHTLDHIAYLGSGTAFVGDTLFSIGCGRLFEGTAAQMLRSLELLAELPADTILYCAHEYTLDNLRFARAVLPDDDGLASAEREARIKRAEGRPTVPSTLEFELRHNPFMRCSQDAVRDACSNHEGRALSDPIEVFASLRHWKDGFR